MQSSKHTHAWCVAVFASGVLLGVPVVRAELPNAADLRSVLSAGPDAHARVGACVVDLSTGATVFAEKADLSLTPASVMKLFTMAASLRTLGPDFHFETILATDGTNLFVIGDGDPAFGDEKLSKVRGEAISADFDRWAEALLESGVTTIPGDLVIDESIFDDQRVHPSWEKRDLGKWFAAPVGALNYNDNCVDLTASPGAALDQPAVVSVHPQTDFIEIVNKCKTGTGRNPVLHHPPGSFRYIISGRCNKRWAFPPVAFADPGLLFAESFRTVLTSHDISIAGGLRRERVRRSDGTIPKELKTIAVKRTPLADVLHRIGKNSQNLFAECLLKRTGLSWAAGHGEDSPLGTWATGQASVGAMLRDARIGTTGFSMADGSGLSRENSCTARQLAELLTWMRRQPSAEVFLESLTVSGVDGSLRGRLRDFPGRVQAKTGTMKRVSALAGYLGDADAPQYAFAIIFNGYNGPATPYKEIQDRFCRILSRKPASRAAYP